jgi:hypothetical protein
MRCPSVIGILIFFKFLLNAVKSLSSKIVYFIVKNIRFVISKIQLVTPKKKLIYVSYYLLQ